MQSPNIFYQLALRDNTSLDYVKEYLTATYKEDQVLEKSFNNSFTYLSILSQGLSFSFKDSILENTFIHGRNDKKFQPHLSPLPFGLHIDMNNQQIVGFFGEPDEKEGGDIISITIIYKWLGLEFTFFTKAWDMKLAGIEQITLFKPTGTKTHGCGVCRKDATNKCSGCKLVYYCGQQCQKTHWGCHQVLCKKQNI